MRMATSEQPSWRRFDSAWLLHDLDALHPTGKLGQDRGLIAQPGSDLEDALMWLGAEEVGHERDYEGLRDRLIEADRQRRVLVSERGQEGGHEAVPRDLAHRGQHAFVEGRLAQLLARKVDLDSDDLDHVPPQDCEMRFAHRLPAQSEEDGPAGSVRNR